MKTTKTMKLLPLLTNKYNGFLFLKFLLLIALISLMSCSGRGGSQLFGKFSFSGKEVYISEGFFVMGSDKGNTDEQPERNVYISNFLIDTKEVSKIEYSDCVNAGDCNFPLEGDGFV